MNNKTLFKWFSMLLLMMVAGISDAAAQSLGLADFSIQAGETKTVAITLTSDAPIYGIQTDIVLSEGLSLEGLSKVADEPSLSSNVLGSGATRVSLLSLAGNALAAGEVINLSVKADENFTEGTIKLTNSRLTTTTQGTEQTVGDVTANVTLDSPFVGEPEYYLVGTMNNWFGLPASVNIDDAYKLTLNQGAEGVEYMLADVALTTTDQFKIIKLVGNTATWYPDGTGNNYGENGEITADGTYTIYFRPGADGGNDWFQGCIYVASNAVGGDDDPLKAAPEGWTLLVKNGNLASDDVSSYVMKDVDHQQGPAVITAGAGKNNSHGIVLKSADREYLGKNEKDEDQWSGADWDTQFFIVLDKALPVGSKLHVEFDCKASKNAVSNTQSHYTPGAYQHWACIGDVNFTTEWQTFSKDIEVTAEMAGANGLMSIAFNLSVEKTATEYYFDNFGVWYQEPAIISDWTDLIINGDMEGESTECFYVTEQYVGGPYVAKFTEGIGKDGSKAVKVLSGDGPTQDWDSQFFIRLPYQVPGGTKYRISFDYKANKAGDFDTQSHAEPGQYIHWACIGSGSFTTEWQTYSAEGTVPAECDGSQGNGFLKLLQSIAFNLAKNKVETEFIFDNVKFEVPSDVAATLTLNPAVNPTPYPEKPVINSMAINGTFPGMSWDADKGIAMTQDAEDADVWTATMENVTVEGIKYEYKAFANGETTGYQLPAGTVNAEFEFGTSGYPAGDYNLTFTANTKKNTLTLEAEEVGTQTFTATFTTNADWGSVYAYTFSKDEGGAVIAEELGAWPGTKLTADAAGVYTVTIKAKNAPGFIIFNNGNSGEGNQTEDLVFENGKAYEFTVAAGTETALKEAPEGWTLATTNGNLAEEDASSYVMKEYPSSDIVPAAIVTGAGTNGSRGILVKAGDDTANEGAQDWDSQFWIVLNEELPSGSKLHVEFDYKASEAATANTQSHGEPGAYLHWAAIGDVNFTTEWQHFSNDITVDDAMAKGDNGNGSGTGMKTIAFNLAVNRNAVNYQFDNFGVWYQKPVEIETMAIVGEFLGLEGDANWDPANGWQMEKDAENPAIWTLTKPFTAEAKTYEYKATANGKWGDYELPAEGNQNFEFGTEEYPAGEYNLTFTADTENNTLTLDVEKASIKTFTATFTTNAPWSKVYAYAWTTTDEGDQGTTTEYLGAWPGTELTAGADDVYTVTIKGEDAPAMIIFSNGDTGEGNQTEDLAFEDGKAYEYVFTPTFDFENNNGGWAANLDLTTTPITMDGVTLTGISGNVKIKEKGLIFGNGSFKLTAPEGKSIKKVEIKWMSGTFNIGTQGCEPLTEKQKMNDEESIEYSVLAWTGPWSEVTFSTTARGTYIGYINVTLEDAAIVIPDDAIVYDFAAEQALIAAGTVTKPSNVGGSAANGQAFYGWENPEKTDSKRQDYKGYAKAEGSVLPEECHVWRRNDRYDQDASWTNVGGLTCPNDREYAIDGLGAGDKVIIVYDASAAAEDSKDMIWAIGDGSSDQSLTGPRATATIGGVEAVTGTTTIASGAEILVNSVTPAENGTGYIVFKVKKGMIINQIAIIKAEEPALEQFYIMGTGTENEWNGTTAMTLNSETNAFEYEVTLTGESYITFGDAEFTANGDESWSQFNGVHRYAIQEGNVTPTLGEAVQLVKVNDGNIKLTEAGKYLFSVSKDLKLTVTRTGDVPVEEADYYLTGTMTDWSTVAADLANYKLTRNEGAEGVDEYMIKNVAFEASAQFKVIKVEEGKDPIWYPTGMDNNYTIQIAGNYDVYFRPNKDGGEGWHEGYIYATASLDKSALEDEIATATALLGDASTEEGTPGKALADAIAAAQQALQNATTQDEINNAVQALKDAEEAYKTATGIAGLYLGKYADGEWYTIQGVRIDRPTTKGLYIRNGRTVVVK